MLKNKYNFYGTVAKWPHYGNLPTLPRNPYSAIWPKYPRENSSSKRQLSPVVNTSIATAPSGHERIPYRIAALWQYGRISVPNTPTSTVTVRHYAGIASL